MDRYFVRAKIESIVKGEAKIVIYFADNFSVNHYGQELKFITQNNAYRNVNEICSFKIDLKEIGEIKEHIYTATVLGFNVDVGVAIQVLSSDSKGDSMSSFEYTITFTNEEKEMMRSEVAKAHLLNKT